MKTDFLEKLKIQVLNKRKLAWAIFFTALVVRLVYTVAVLNTRGLEKGYDAGDYIQFAEQMHSQGWMVEDISNIQLHAGPGYPLILYFDTWLTQGNSYYLSLGVNILLGALMCLILFNFLLELGLTLSLSAMASFWGAFYVHFIRYVSELNKETLVLFLLLVVVRLLYKQSFKISLVQLFLAGLCYAYLIHVDERYFFYFPFLLAFLVIPVSKKAVLNAFVFMAVVGTLMLPWLYRNYIVYERPVILTERTAPFTDKILGYNTPANPYRKDPVSPYKRANLPIYEAFRDSMVGGEKVQSTGYRYLSLMYEAISKGDTPTTQNMLKAKAMEFWELYKPVHFGGTFTANGYRYQRKWKVESNLIYGLQYGLLLVLLPFGLFNLYKRNRRVFSIAVLILCVHSLIHVFIAYGLQRYRVPIDFLLIILAAFGVDLIFKKIKGNNEVE